MDELRQVLHEQVALGNAPGVVVLVSHGGQRWVETAGVSRIDGPAMSRDTIVRAASITKPLLAALTMTLAQDGTIALDAPVGAWLPELASPRVLTRPDAPVDETVPCRRPITVYDLLTFQGGLGFPIGIDAPVGRLITDYLEQGPPHPGDHPDPDTWMSRVADVPLVHQPGEGWLYNTQYDVLGVLLARAARSSLAELFATRLTGPLGMVDTAFFVPPDRLDRFATYYRHTEAGFDAADEPTGQWSAPPAFASGAGGLVTTVDDWCAFGEMLLAGGAGVLTEASVAQLMTDTTTPMLRDFAGFFLDGQGWGYGGSVDIVQTKPWESIGRYGWVGGTTTAAYVDPGAGTVTVVAAQVELGGRGTAELLESVLSAAR